MLHPKIEEEIRRHVWAMTPEAFSTMLRAVDGHELTDVDRPAFHASEKGIRAELDAETEGTGLYYSEINGDTGIMYVDGPLTPRASWFTRASGITSTDLLASDLARLEASADVKQIVMVFDSPGGAVTGTSEFAAQIKATEKPVHAYVFGMAASAAYWIASAADSITASDTGLVGSIGTVMTAYKDDDGTRKEYVSSQSPLKRAQPDTEEGDEYYQGLVDNFSDIFIAAVAENRGVTVETVLSEFGRGGVFLAGAAKKRGMIDGVSTFANFMQNFDFSVKYSENNGIEAASDAEQTITEEIEEMDLKEFLKQNPAAQIEVDKLVSDACASMAGDLSFAAEIACSDKYSKAVRAIAAGVIQGKKSKETLDAVVAVEDMQHEKEQSAAAVEATVDLKPTPPTPTASEPSYDGKIRTTEDFLAAVKKMKEGR